VARMVGRAARLSNGLRLRDARHFSSLPASGEGKSALKIFELQIPIAPAVGCSICSARQRTLRAGEKQIAELPRLNNVIRAWEAGSPAFTSFAQAEVENAVAMSTSKFDGVVYEMEHNFWDARALRDAMQYMLNRRQIVQGGTFALAVTPMVRI